MLSATSNLPVSRLEAEDKPQSYRHAFSWLTWWAAFLFATLLGFARLSYGQLLPALQDDLRSPYSTLSTVATMNFVGYLLGTLIMPVLLARVRNHQLLNLAALVAMNLTMLGAALSFSIWQLGAWRIFNGLFSAVATVLTMTLTLECIHPRERGQASAIIWMGGAIGLIISGLIAPTIINGAASGWRVVWVLMGILGIVAALGYFLCRRHQSAPVVQQAKMASSHSTLWTTLRPLLLPSRLLWLALAFLSFGGGYITYFTFFIALLQQQGVPALYAGFAWAAIGLAASVSAWIWGRILDRWPSGFTLAVPLAFGVLGSLAVLTNTPGIEYTGAALVGLSALLAPPIMTTVLLKRAVPDKDYAISYSATTAIFAIGQIVGPLLGGAIISSLGLQAGIASSAGLLALAALCAVAYALAQRKHPAL